VSQVRTYLSREFAFLCREKPRFSAGVRTSEAVRCKLYVGTSGGQVYRYGLGGGWTRTHIDNATGGALPLTGIVTKTRPTRPRSLSAPMSASGDRPTVA
jgi:hypothetical protein